MNLKSALIKLFYLLVHADGEMNPREVELGNQMIKLEGGTETEFLASLTSLKDRNAAHVYAEGIEELKKLDHLKQVRCVAWLCLVANADGFMDKSEWQFIYKIYYNELALNLDEIMKAQKELASLTAKKTTSLLSVL